MSLFMRRFSLAMFSPFFPIAFPMSPSFTTKMSLSPASTQSTTVVRVRSWNSATYLIVCSSKTISAMRILDAEDVRLAGADYRNRGNGERHPARGAQVHVRTPEAEPAHVPEVLDGVLRAVRGEDDELRALRLRCATDLPQPEPHVARVRRNPEGAGHVDHGTTSSNGSSGSGGGGTGAVAARFCLRTAIGFCSPGGGL